MPRSVSLADLVAPTEVSRFRSEIQGREHAHFTGEPGRFSGLMTWPALNEIIELHRLTPPRLRLVNDGVMVDQSDYFDDLSLPDGGHELRLLPGPFLQKLRGGATLVVDAIEDLHGPARALASGLERDLREHVQINLYASWGTSHGFDLHWDNHDVIALQIAGRKHWRLYGRTRPYPLERDVAPPQPPTGEPIAEYLLEEGEVLYLPRGHWHDVAAAGVPTIHLTCGFTPATGISLAEWLVDRLRADERFRQDLPRFADPEQRTTWAKTLYAAIGEVMDPDVIDRFLTEHDANARLTPGISLPWAATPEVLPPAAGDDTTTVRFLTPRAALEHRADGTVALLAVGHQWTFAAAAGPVLAALADGRPWTIGALHALPGSALAPDTVRALLAELVVGGLVVVRGAT